MQIDKNLIDRFWKYVQKGPGCWEWIGNKRPNGYGRITKSGGGTSYGAHRASYAIHYGPFPSELEVLHKCDNPGCVRPDHLFLGTQADNNRDRCQKGRWKGYMKGRPKMTEEQVHEFLRLRSEGVLLSVLAKRYGIDASQASRIAAGVSWRWLRK